MSVLVESKDTVRRIYKGSGEMQVAFWRHDAIFRVMDADLARQILAAWAEKREISFTFDHVMRIVAVH